MDAASRRVLIAPMLTKAETQRIRDLRERRHRQAAGLFVVEGEKVVGELVAANAPLERIYVTAASSIRPKSGTAAVERITDAEMARISHFPTPSSALALGRMPAQALAASDLARGITLALDGVQDPGNVGTMLRIADWFGAARVLLSPDCADLFAQKTINASMGSFIRVTAHVADLPAVLSGLAVPILGCDLSGEDVSTLAPLADAVVVIGSEGQGIRADTRARLTRTVTIARRGSAESLNAAVAAGIVLHRLAAPN